MCAAGGPSSEAVIGHASRPNTLAGRRPAPPPTVRQVGCRTAHLTIGATTPSAGSPAERVCDRPCGSLDGQPPIEPAGFLAACPGSLPRTKRHGRHADLPTQQQADAKANRTACKKASNSRRSTDAPPPGKQAWPSALLQACQPASVLAAGWHFSGRAANCQGANHPGGRPASLPASKHACRLPRQSAEMPTSQQPPEPVSLLAPRA